MKGTPVSTYQPARFAGAGQVTRAALACLGISMPLWLMTGCGSDSDQDAERLSGAVVQIGGRSLTDGAEIDVGLVYTRPILSFESVDPDQETASSVAVETDAQVSSVRTLSTIFDVILVNGSPLSALAVEYLGFGFDIVLTDASGFRLSSAELMSWAVTTGNQDLELRWGDQGLDCSNEATAEITVDEQVISCQTEVTPTTSRSLELPPGGATNLVSGLSSRFTWTGKDMITTQLDARVGLFLANCRSEMSSLETLLAVTALSEEPMSEENQTAAAEVIDNLGKQCQTRLATLLDELSGHEYLLQQQSLSLQASWLAEFTAWFESLPAPADISFAQRVQLRQWLADTRHDLNRFQQYNFPRPGTYAVSVDLSYDIPNQAPQEQLNFTLVVEDNNLASSIAVYFRECGGELERLHSELTSNSSEGIEIGMSEVDNDCVAQQPLLHAYFDAVDYSVPEGLETFNTAWTQQISALLAEIQATLDSGEAANAEQLAELDTHRIRVEADFDTLGVDAIFVR